MSVISLLLHRNNVLLCITESFFAEKANVFLSLPMEAPKSVISVAFISYNQNNMQ